MPPTPFQSPTRTPGSEKRQKNYRTICSQKLLNNFGAALCEKWFVVEQDVKDDCCQEYKLEGPKAPGYEQPPQFRVKIDSVPHCTCRHGSTENDASCKHILFVLIRIIGLMPFEALMYQRAFVATELEELKKRRLDNDKSAEKYWKNYASKAAEDELPGLFTSQAKIEKVPKESPPPYDVEQPPQRVAAASTPNRPAGVRTPVEKKVYFGSPTVQASVPRFALRPQEQTFNYGSNTFHTPERVASSTAAQFGVYGGSSNTTHQENRTSSSHRIFGSGSAYLSSNNW